ncbi:sulfotransferase [Burkholderia contaminans]|nr:sulfotransferase [Burkholderia contaminans]
MSAPADPHDAALASAQAALAQAPDNAQAWHRLGMVWEEDHAYEAAVDCYRRATELDPHADGSYNNLGNCLNVLGRLDDAQAAWRTAIELEPHSASYYRNLVQFTTLAADDPCFVSLEQQVAQSADWPADRQADLFFAYGQSLTGIGEPGRGFAHLSRANTLYRSLTRYDEAAMLGLLGQMTGAFSADLLRAKSGLGDASASPVFVFGMPRSGTTLVEQILASHPRVFGAGESDAFVQCLVQAVAPGAGGLALDALDAAAPESLRALGAAYLQRVARKVPGGPYARIVDKYLYNFINAGFIHLALPNARLIHVRRDPVDTCLSIFARCFHDVPFSYDLGELGRFYRAYDALVAHWRAALPPGVLLEVRYEHLVEDFDTQVRRMLTHCGLDWSDRCTVFHETRRQVTTASAAQVRRPLYRDALRPWRPDADTLRPLFDGLGPGLATGAGD